MASERARELAVKDLVDPLPLNFTHWPTIPGHVSKNSKADKSPPNQTTSQVDSTHSSHIRALNVTGMPLPKHSGIRF